MPALQVEWIQSTAKKAKPARRTRTEARWPRAARTSPPTSAKGTPFTQSAPTTNPRLASIGVAPRVRSAPGTHGAEAQPKPIPVARLPARAPLHRRSRATATSQGASAIPARGQRSHGGSATARSPAPARKLHLLRFRWASEVSG
jgi:hypothetical protein